MTIQNPRTERTQNGPLRFVQFPKSVLSTQHPRADYSNFCMSTYANSLSSSSSPVAISRHFSWSARGGSGCLPKLQLSLLTLLSDMVIGHWSGKVGWSLETGFRACQHNPMKEELNQVRIAAKTTARHPAPKLSSIVDCGLIEEYDRGPKIPVGTTHNAHSLHVLWVLNGEIMRNHIEHNCSSQSIYFSVRPIKSSWHPPEFFLFGHCIQSRSWSMMKPLEHCAMSITLNSKP